MDRFEGRIAVVTGGGTGMGRELARQLSAEGCHVAICDVSEENMVETRALCLDGAPDGTEITTHVCDVSDEAQVLAFRDEVAEAHETEHVHLLFNNAGIGGGGSFVSGRREDWDRTFAVCWYGVYYCSRAFLPLLVASEEAHLVNTSSVNGFWASLGPGHPHTAYSAAKFAVKGFSEALITDLRLNAPHVKVSVVMPGHIGTSIALNTMTILGRPVDAAVTERAATFRNTAPTTAGRAATVILDGVRADRWRILIGEDAHIVDATARDHPEEAYEPAFLERLHAQGAFQGVTS
ncbi:MAG: SDR family NAD(P)-dependent oxidoreductase [Acidimicrobiia bacterium]|nr:SDR family NAD(P)-dependent oxidoreductase [Acidimicrobiia bacterium]